MALLFELKLIIKDTETLNTVFYLQYTVYSIIHGVDGLTCGHQCDVLLGVCGVGVCGVGVYGVGVCGVGVCGVG